MQFKFTICNHWTFCLDKTIYNALLHYGNQPSLKKFSRKCIQYRSRKKSIWFTKRRHVQISNNQLSSTLSSSLRQLWNKWLFLLLLLPYLILGINIKECNASNVQWFAKGWIFKKKSFPLSLIIWIRLRNCCII